MTPLVSIIIINYNTPGLVYDCLDSIERHFSVPYEVLVVENGSSSQVKKEKIEARPHTTLLVSEKNRGFGGGNNFGAKVAKGKYVWFLNSDTLLIDSSLNQLFNALENFKRPLICSPLLYNDTALHQLQPDFYASFQSLFTLITRRPRPNLNLAQEWFQTDVVVGASLIINRELFKTLEGFDEHIFMFFEDDDLCYRARQLGVAVSVYTKARLIHLQGKSISTNQVRKKLYYKSQDYFWEKHHSSFSVSLMKVLRVFFQLRPSLTLRKKEIK